jgi:hypothetical protein
MGAWKYQISISSVEHDISRVSAANEWDIMFNTRNKSGISKRPCIFLFIINIDIINIIINNLTCEIITFISARNLYKALLYNKIQLSMMLWKWRHDLQQYKPNSLNFKHHFLFGVPSKISSF